MQSSVQHVALTTADFQPERNTTKKTRIH